MQRGLLRLGLCLSALGVACATRPASEATTSTTTAGRDASDPVVRGAPCDVEARSHGFEVADHGLEHPTVSIRGELTTERDTALCPADALVPEDGFALTAEAHESGLVVHIFGVGEDDAVVTLPYARGVTLDAGATLRVPETGGEFHVSGDSGVEFVIFVVSRGPLAERDPDLAALVASADQSSADAARLRLAPRGEILVDGPNHRIDAAGDVIVVPFPVQHRTLSQGRTRGVFVDPYGVFTDP